MSDRTVTFQELPAARRTTEAISQYLQQRLSTYLDTLKALLAPERVFGKHVGGKGDVMGVDKAVNQVAQSYREVAGKPLELPREFDPEWLAGTGSRLELHRIEYVHTASANNTAKPIHITSPVRWILAYGSAITPFQALQIAAGKERDQSGALRQFAVNALVMQQVLARYPGLAEIFKDLRFELRIEHFPDTGKLPFATISSFIPSYRPSDELILTATEFSGVAAFIELIDISALDTLRDPLKQQIEALSK